MNKEINGHEIRIPMDISGPQMQTRLGPDNGNCFNACIATMLCVPLESVDVVWNKENWLEQLDKILSPLGYCFIEWEWDNPDHGWHWVGECYMIATGYTKRSSDVLHSVIVHHLCDAERKHTVVDVFDPHPSGAFLTSIKYIGVLFPHHKERFQ